MKAKTFIKIIVLVVLVALVLWLGAMLTDAFFVFRIHQRPIFASASVIVDDTGSGIYKGLGYSIEVTGDFSVPRDDQTVSQAEFFLFGFSIFQLP